MLDYMKMNVYTNHQHSADGKKRKVLYRNLTFACGNSFTLDDGLTYLPFSRTVEFNDGLTLRLH